tara:strand:+ start:1182 stop:1307 length:126 start_codon:yes stop_codon:yes gene_type:complete
MYLYLRVNGTIILEIFDEEIANITNGIKEKDAHGVFAFYLI